MSQTLGEKFREAREERGISISEVAEQTRISSLYIGSIEKDDYKPLPGGIFNKGFVKSYAKFIGIDEHEALQDYAKIITETEGRDEGDLRKYKPEVLTDDNSSSIVPTIIFAGIILALMTGGILFVVNYIQNQPDTPPTARNTANSSNSNAVANEASPAENTGVPAMTSLKVEFRAGTDPVSLSSVTDGKNAVAMVAGGASVLFEPRDALKLSYSKSLAQSARLLINGKQIELPQAPREPRRAAIEFEINKDNLNAIWESGRISFDQPAPPDSTEPSPTPAVALQPTPALQTPNPTPRNAAATPPPPTPRPTRSTIVVSNANRP